MSYHTILIVTILIVGRLGRAPEMRYTPSGQPVTNFNLAVNRSYTAPSGEVTKETLWFKVTAWGKTAEICGDYLHKGSLVLVEGRLVCEPETGGPRIFTRKDGTPSASFEVTASTVRFLSGGEGEGEDDGSETDANRGSPWYGEIQF
jgi:single-strand DNA-binding protein